MLCTYVNMYEVNWAHRSSNSIDVKLMDGTGTGGAVAPSIRM